MSHDELSPGSTPPRDSEDVASSAAQAPSAQDAPPPASARRRRARPAGTDAASPPIVSNTEKPARATRSRRKPEATPVPETDLPDPSAAAQSPTADSPAPPAPRASQRSRKSSAPKAQAKAPPKTRAAESAPSVPAPEPVKPEVAPPVLSETASPAPTAARRQRRSSRARKPAATESATLSDQSAPVLDKESAPSPEASSLSVADTSEEAKTPSGRKRAVRTRKPAATAIEPLIPAEIIPESEPSVPETFPIDAALTEAERPGRRRRTRGRKTAITEEISTPAVAPVEAPLPVEAVAESAETTTSGRARRRRGRRAGVARAEALPVVAEIPEVVIVEPEVDRTVGAHLISRNGIPEIHIDNVVYPPVLFFGNLETAANRAKVVSEVQRAAKAGVHLHSTLIELPCPLSESSSALDEIDNRLRTILDADPDGYVMPRIVFVPARGWKREYPTEIATYTDGATGDPSLSSERFWQEAERSLDALIGHLGDYAWGKRVFGYHLERGEWFQPAEQGYDRSMANRDAFRDWLREKYRHNLISLRAAWYDGDVQFHTADIPPAGHKPNPVRAFYEPRRERRIIDFHEFTSESTARRLISLAQTVKKASGRQALVSVCYGYTFEFGHTFSGHLALGMLQDSPAIDLICGPPSYRDRKPGGAASFPAPIDSLPLHGKLWLSEDDTKTFLAPAQQDPEDFNPRMGDRFTTEQAQARTLGRTLSHTTAIGFMDLWGEGWLDDDTIWERLATFTSRYAIFMQQKEYPRVPDVVALIDEKSLLHVQRGEPFLRKLTSGLRDVLQRAGISYGIYLQSDLLADSFPLEAKLYLFLTPYRLTSEQRAAIKEKLQRDDKTLAWLYAPGSCEERPSLGGALEETATAAVGIALRQQEWNSEVGSRIVETHHPVTEKLQVREIGTRERLNPSFYVDDTDAVTLAEYQGSGLPSLAVKNCGAWKSVFVGDPVLTVDLLRGICRYAGVHLWMPQGEDILEIGNGWVTLHAVRDGQRTLRLPDLTGLYDLTEGRMISDLTREQKVFMRSGTTRSYCIGTPERFRLLGLPNVALPDPSRPRPALEVFEKTESRREPSLPKPRNSDLETLEAVLNMDISALDLDALPDDPLDTVFLREPLTTMPEEETTGEMVTGGRRRRRRGGRGRGRRRAGEELDAVSPSLAPGDLPDALTGEVISLDSTEIIEYRHSWAESYPWEPEAESGKESPHAEADPNDEGDPGF